MVIGPTDHMGDGHVHVVDHDGEIVKGGSVTALDDGISDLRGVLTTRAEDEIIETK